MLSASTASADESSILATSILITVRYWFLDPAPEFVPIAWMVLFWLMGKCGYTLILDEKIY